MKKLNERIKGLRWFDEYTDAISENHYRAIKSACDGVGREKRKMSRDLSPLFDDDLGHELPGTDSAGDRVVKLCYWALYVVAAIMAIAVVTAK